MGKIADLFVHLGLKKESFDKGLDSVKKGFGNIKALAIGVWGAIGTAAVACADSFAHVSQRFGDAWDVTVNQMKAAWQTFISTLSSWDWEGFGQRVRNAMRSSKDVTKANDVAFEVQNSIDLRKSEIAQELEDLKTQARNQKLSYQEREKAAKTYLDKVKGFYDEEAAIREKQAIAAQNHYLTLAGIDAKWLKGEEGEHTRKLLQTFLKDVVPDEERMKFYLDRYEKGNTTALDKLANFYYKGSNDALVSQVVKAVVASNYASSAFSAENQRMMTLMNSAGAQAGKGSEALTEAEKMAQAAKAVRDSWVELTNLDNPLANVGVAVQESCEDIKDGLMQVVEATQQAEIIARNGWKGTFEGWLDYMQQMAYVMEDASMQIRQAIVYGISDSMAELSAAIMGTEKIDAGKAFSALLKPMADAVTTIGEMIMMTGLAEIAFKKSFSNPWTAVAAGAALIAVGQLASAGIQKALGGGTSSSAASSTSTTSTTNDYSGELTIYVKGEIKGDAIAISGQRTINQWNR